MKSYNNLPKYQKLNSDKANLNIATRLSDDLTFRGGENLIDPRSSYNICQTRTQGYGPELPEDANSSNKNPTMLDFLPHPSPSLNSIPILDKPADDNNLEQYFPINKISHTWNQSTSRRMTIDKCVIDPRR